MRDLLRLAHALERDEREDALAHRGELLLRDAELLGREQRRLDPAIGQACAPIEGEVPRLAAMPPRAQDVMPPFPPSPSTEHATLRDLVRDRLASDGQHDTPLPNLRFYRFSEPTTFSKAPAFGVTLGVVLSGTKDIRVEGTTLRADPSRLLVITKETEYERATVGATREEP